MMKMSSGIDNYSIRPLPIAWEEITWLYPADTEFCGFSMSLSSDNHYLNFNRWSGFG
jgi:hypothetical protein